MYVFVFGSGQKCSAQSILFVHENWRKAGLLEKLKKLAARRNLDDLTVSMFSVFVVVAVVPSSFLSDLNTVPTHDCGLILLAHQPPMVCCVSPPVTLTLLL